jgi:hypothetical protein
LGKIMRLDVDSTPSKSLSLYVICWLVNYWNSLLFVCCFARIKFPHFIVFL